MASEAEKNYLKIGDSLKGAEESQLFGKPCFKINGKAFICFFENCMVFKLTGDFHKNAMSLEKAVLFDPSGKGRAMKEWVQLPAKHAGEWPVFAKAAMDYASKSK